MGGETINTKLDFSLRQAKQPTLNWIIDVFPIGLICFMSLGTYFQPYDATAGRFAGFAGSLLTLISKTGAVQAVDPNSDPDPDLKRSQTRRGRPGSVST